MRNVKYENILTLVMLIMFGGCVWTHINTCGLYSQLPMEIAMYLTMIITIRSVVKDIRKNPKNWK